MTDRTPRFDVVRAADIHSVLADGLNLVLAEFEIRFDLVVHRGSFPCADVENGCQLAAVDALECPKDCLTVIPQSCASIVAHQCVEHRFHSIECFSMLGFGFPISSRELSFQGMLDTVEISFRIDDPWQCPF